MVIPSILFIEMALENLKTRVAEVPEWPPLVEGGPKTNSLDREVNEYREVGNRPDNLDTLNLSERERGYVLGLETARTLLATMPSAVIAKVTL